MDHTTLHTIALPQFWKTVAEFQKKDLFHTFHLQVKLAPLVAGLCCVFIKTQQNMSSLSRLSERTINFLWVRKKLFYCFRNWTLPGLRNTQENVFEIGKEKFEYCNCNQNASNVFFFFSQSQRLQLVSWPPSDFQAFTRAVLPHNLPGEKLSKFSQSLSKPASRWWW